MALGGYRGWGRPTPSSERRRRTTTTSSNRRPSNNATNAGYNVATSAGRSSISPGLSNVPGVNQTAADQYWGITGVPGMGNQGTREGFRGYRAAVGSAGYGGLAPTAVMPTGGGGGGYGGGRGGGGGGGSGLTQQMLDAMMQALGARGPQLTLQQANLPEFVGTPMAAFNAQPYTQAAQQLEAARAADAAAINQAGTQATQALQKNYSNAYANTPVAAGPQAAPIGVGLQQTVGGGGNQQAVTDVNQAAAGDQASFQNLLNVLAAVDQSSQNSRLNEVALNTGTAQNALGAQARGLGAGINMAQAQARNQWGQAANEREYQNSLMRQQWQRENMQRNQDIANQQAQGRWQQTNEMISSRLGPLLELLAGGNVNGLQQLLQGWQQ